LALRTAALLMLLNISNPVNAVQPNLAQIKANLSLAEATEEPANASLGDSTFTILADDSETGTSVQATEF